MKADEQAGNITGFRAILIVGAVVTTALGIWGLFFSGLLHTALGPEVDRDIPGFLAMARLYGAAMLALGVGYVLAAVDPLKNRGMLVVLFVLPLAGAIALIIASAKGEVSTPKGSVFAALDFAYCLLYFRLYPRPAIPESVRPGTEDEEPGGEGAEEPQVRDEAGSSDERST